MQIGPNLPLNNWPSDADCPTLHDFSATPVAKKPALPRLRRPAPKHQNNDSNQKILSTPRPRDRSFGECLHALDAPTHGNATLFAAFHRANLALSSIAAPTAATVFLQVSLSKMPRSISRSLSILPRGISDQG